MYWNVWLYIVQCVVNCHNMLPIYVLYFGPLFYRRDHYVLPTSVSHNISTNKYNILTILCFKCIEHTAVLNFSPHVVGIPSVISCSTTLTHSHTRTGHLYIILIIHPISKVSSSGIASVLLER